MGTPSHLLVLFDQSQDSQHLSNRVWKEPSKEELFPLGRYAETRKLLELERRRDYNDYLRQLSAGRNRVWKEPSKEEFFPLGTYEETRKKLRQERWLEYNEMLKSRDVSGNDQMLFLVWLCFWPKWSMIRLKAQLDLRGSHVQLHTWYFPKFLRLFIY